MPPIQHGERQVVTRSVEGPIAHDQLCRDPRAARCKVAQRLERDGIKLGDRVATLAWNTWRHLECWYGILGIGAIYHTVNPRLFPDQIVWIVNHAEDRMMFVDLTFVPLLEKIADKLPTIERYIVLTDAAHMPQTTLKNAVRLRGLDRRGRRRFRLDERSTRTPRPACATPPAPPAIPRACSIRTAPTCCTPSWRRCRTPRASRRATSCMPVVPLFHANGWSLAFSTPMIGATLVLPGAEARRRLDLRTARHLQGDVHRRRCRRSG